MCDKLGNFPFRRLDPFAGFYFFVKGLPPNLHYARVGYRIGVFCDLAAVEPPSTKFVLEQAKFGGNLTPKKSKKPRYVFAVAKTPLILTIFP